MISKYIRDYKNDAVVCPDCDYPMVPYVFVKCVELKIIAVIFLTKCDFCDEAFFVVEKILAKIIFGIIKLFLFFENRCCACLVKVVSCYQL